MRPFRDQPIARKALTLGLAPTISALIVVILASLVSTFFMARQNQFRDVETQATIVGENIGAGLAFRDREAVDEIIQALSARPNIEMACVYDIGGDLFTAFQRPPMTCPPTWPAPINVMAPIAHTQVRAGVNLLGTVVIQGNYATLLSWMRTQTLVGFAALVAGVLVAVGLTRRLQRAVSAPIIELASTLDRVSVSNDYSTRAVRRTGDEVGRLVDSFNSMVEVIQRKDTERNELLEKSEESNRVKDEFLATVSHELRTPLNAMLGWLQIIRDPGVDNAVVQRGLASIERNAQSQARLVEDLIELSRVVTGKLRLRPRALDLRQVVEASVDVVRTAAIAKSVALQMRIPAEPCHVSGDRDRLQQVVWNLLSNAVKFTDAGGSVVIELAATARQCSISVKDDGIGIAPEFLPFVFDRFRQADQSTTREHGGLGLGLAIAKEITELHGGTLEVSSAGRGRGSQLTITLPRLQTKELPIAPEPFQLPDFSAMRILVVDDDPESLEIATQALSTTRAAVTQASSGPEALEHWKAGPFDVVICDVAMPMMDGFEVITHIRRSGSSGARCRAVALTALASDANRQAVLDGGFDEHIAKPFKFPDLLKAVSGAELSATRQAAQIGTQESVLPRGQTPL